MPAKLPPKKNDYGYGLTEIAPEDPRQETAPIAPEDPTTIAGTVPRDERFYYCREKRRRGDVLVQLGTRVRAEVRDKMREHSAKHDESITDLIERSVLFMMDHSQERP